MAVASNIASVAEPLIRSMTPKMTEFIPHFPSPKQRAFMLLQCEEAMYGGAAGGGKSDAILMCALQYVDVPGYAALILRRTFSDLALPDAIMARALDWLKWRKDVLWNNEIKTFTFPSGATLTFGFLKSENDKYRYQSTRFHFVAFDEVTQFTETQYTYLFSRNRRGSGETHIPLRFRAASNPGGVGHQWVKARFITRGSSEGRVFVPAKLKDNAFLDYDSYVKSLRNLDPVTRRQLLDGDWDARFESGVFRKTWFTQIEARDIPPSVIWVRYWDTAASETQCTVCRARDYFLLDHDHKAIEGDWTVGVKLGLLANGKCIVADVKRIQGSPERVEALMLNTALADGYGVTVVIQQEPGSGSLSWILSLARGKLMGFSVTPDRVDKVTGSKFVRSQPVSAAAERKDLMYLVGMWNQEFFEELEAFGPDDSLYEHDDQVDAFAGAYNWLCMHRGGAAVVEYYKLLIDQAKAATEGNGHPERQLPIDKHDNQMVTPITEVTQSLEEAYRSGRDLLTPKPPECAAGCGNPLGTNRIEQGRMLWHPECFRPW